MLWLDYPTKACVQMWKTLASFVINEPNILLVKPEELMWIVLYVEDGTLSKSSAKRLIKEIIEDALLYKTQLKS